MPPIQYLFVYGSLRKAQDGSMHGYLQRRALFVDTATLPGELYEISGYPGALLESSSLNRIHGEVYRLLEPEAVLHTLDVYEECSPDFPIPQEYQRIQKTVTLSTGQSVIAWIYVYCHSVIHCKFLENGDYAVYLPQTHHQ